MAAAEVVAMTATHPGLRLTFSWLYIASEMCALYFALLPQEKA